MHSCVYCNAPLQPGQTFCGSCGQMQPQAAADLQTTVPTGDAIQAPPAPASGPSLPAPYMPASGQPAPPGDLYAQTIRATGPTPGASGDWLATRADAPGLPPPPPPIAPPAPTSESWGPAQPGMPGSMPSGAWTPPGGAGNVPVAPGWQATGSQPWQQPTVGWQPTGSQPWQQGPGSQPWQQGPGSQPWPQAPVMPPPGAPGAAGRKRNGKKIATIIGGIVAAIILLGAAGGLLYALTRPNPSLTITGDASSGTTPTGSPDKVFHIKGQKFSSNETITLLLDGASAPGAPNVQSDSNGAFNVDLTITDDWLVGNHQITARDTSGYVTKTPAQVQIVAAPVIQVQSQYQSGSTPAGAPGTNFHVTGKRFPLNSSITFLLDGKPAPGAASARSDDHGKVDTQFSVTGDWSLGNHTLTAQDAQGDATQAGAPVVIVHQGEAGTPGPNGAPADNASFSVSVSVTAKTSDGQDDSFSDQLQVTGQADPAGGKVCGQYDDGQPHTFNGTLNGGGTFIETIVFSCSGSYKSGHLTYTETATSDKIILSDGSVCTARGSYVYEQLDGTFSDQSAIKGTYRRDYFQANCSSGQYSSIYRNSATGTWQGSQF